MRKLTKDQLRTAFNTLNYQQLFFFTNLMYYANDYKDYLNSLGNRQFFFERIKILETTDIKEIESGLQEYKDAYFTALTECFDQSSYNFLVFLMKATKYYKTKAPDIYVWIKYYINTITGEITNEYY